MVEVIIRNLEKIENDETEVWKVKKILSKYFTFGNVQTSLNSHGHLVVRLMNENYMEEKPSVEEILIVFSITCLLYTSPSPRDRQKSRMPSSA